MFPPKDYFEKHPDFYSMVNGRRVAEGGQLNFGNPEVVTRAAKLVAESFQSQPDVWINYSLTANDWGGFDESPETIALGKTASEQSLAFANNVVTEARKTVPDAKVMFLAYWYTSKAPESNIKAAPGVAVMLVNNTCKGHSLESPLDPAGAVWIKNFDRWAETGAELGVYDWYIPAFHDAIAADIPFIPGEAALQDLRLYQKRGVKYHFYESYNGEKVEAYPIRWPMYYIAAMGMENPDRSATDILRPACDKLFGSAGDAMLRFYLLIAEAYNTTKARGNNWTLPAANIVFSSEITAKLRETLKEAQNVTANADPAVRKRIADVARCWALAETIISGQKKTQKYEIVAEGLGSFFFDKHHIDVPTIRSLVGIADNLQVGVVEKDGSVTPLNPDLPVKLDPDHPLTVRAIAN
jgi:hypothetical protein